MKKLLNRLGAGTERGGMLISICAVALIVLTAMLLPLAFRTSPGEADGHVAGGAEPDVRGLLEHRR